MRTRSDEENIIIFFPRIREDPLSRFVISFEYSKRVTYMSITLSFMIAVVEIGGKQYTVEVGTTFTVDRQHADAGSNIDFAPLLVSDAEGKKVQIGTPKLENIKVTCTVVEHMKAEKIRVFKIKSKKRYNRTQGFRAFETRLTVTAIA